MQPSPVSVRPKRRSRRLLQVLAVVLGALLSLQLAAASPVAGLVPCSAAAAGGLVLWLRHNRTTATAVLSTVVTMMWIPTVTQWVGQAAGVPANVALWEVVPLWALTLAVFAGAWAQSRHFGSRAVTVVLCDGLIAASSLTAAVFPASSVSAAAVGVFIVLALRSSARNWFLRFRAQRGTTVEGSGLREERDSLGRLWLAHQEAPEGQQLYVGGGGQVVTIRPLPAGKVGLVGVDGGAGRTVEAYGINGAADVLAELLNEFAVSDRKLARLLGVNPAYVTSVATCRHSGLPSGGAPVDVAGVWDRESHRYVDHRVVLLAEKDIGTGLGTLPAPPSARPGWLSPGRWSTTTQEGAVDRRQQRVARVVAALNTA